MTDATSTRTLAIAIHDFSFSYENSGAWQLSNVTIELEKGERVAIMGPTGAGKSTLAMSINGLAPHHHEGQASGEVVVDGLRMADHTAYKVHPHRWQRLRSPCATSRDRRIRDPQIPGQQPGRPVRRPQPVWPAASTSR